MFLRKADNLPAGKNQGKAVVGIPNGDHLIRLAVARRLLKRVTLRHEEQTIHERTRNHSNPGILFRAASRGFVDRFLGFQP
jgi:hypothetical protein